VERLGAVIEDYPEWSEPYADRGTAHYFLKHYEEALADLTRAIELNPRHEAAHVNRAVVYSDLNRQEEALADRNKVFELNPRNVTNLGNRAGRHKTVGRLGAAIEDLDRAIDVDPYYVFGYRLRADVKNSLGRFEEAAADARRAIEIDPVRPRAYFALINAYRNLEDDEGAREAIEELRAAADAWVRDETAAWGFRGVAHYSRQLGDLDLALEAANRAIELDPDNPWGFITRARVHRSLGNLRGFRTDCSTAAGMKRESLGDRVSLVGNLGDYCDLWDDARSRVAQVLEEDSNQVVAWRLLGVIDFMQGGLDDALVALDEVIGIDPTHPYGYVARARVFAVRGECDRALRDLEKARSLVPEGLATLARTSGTHTAIFFHTCPERYDGGPALELARDVVAVNPRVLEHQLALGMALYRHGRFDEALAAFDEALAIDTEPANEPPRLFLLALAQWQTDRSREARATYDRAVTLMNEVAPRDPVYGLLRDEAARTLGIDPSR
jgi:tetratricopeptide (TPR) repeat protein